MKARGNYPCFPASSMGNGRTTRSQFGTKFCLAAIWFCPRRCTRGPLFDCLTIATCLVAGCELLHRHCRHLPRPTASGPLPGDLRSASVASRHLTSCVRDPVRFDRLVGPVTFANLNGAPAARPGSHEHALLPRAHTRRNRLETLPTAPQKPHATAHHAREQPGAAPHPSTCSVPTATFTYM